MGTYVGNTLVAGATFNPTLLDFKWTDHILNDVSWLRADTFSWQPGNVYIAVQDFLEENYTPQMLYCWGSANTEFVYSKKRVPEVGDILYDSTGAPMTPTRTVVQFYGENVIDYSYSDSGGTHEFMTQRYAEGNVEQLETETIAGITISYCRGANGLKIVPASQESNVQAIYNATGVAWYYIIDLYNKKFKLPRVNPDVVQYITDVDVYGNGDYLRFMSGSDSSKGSYINSHTESLGSQTGWLRTYNSSGSLVNLGNMKLSDVKGESGIKADTTKYFAGKKHLYFYVGNFTKSAVQQTAGLNAELFNDKVDVGHEVIAFQVPTAANNYTWYRKYADGWVEQGGIWTGSMSAGNGLDAYAYVTLPVAMNDTNYIINITNNSGTGTATVWEMWMVQELTTTQFRMHMGAYANTRTITRMNWEVKGMAAS